ncbi:tRNA (adenosine(37)-N6)-threonylcarbamoyltransferase complex dimerization subunit type 1 TsaB [Rhodoferax sp. PAMC 29310]|uniref:tRNA (adenosine(37)-N6)-threonylcarbamoyltransferase complex dimerization subunit type 1 TsaB n=1 Tax=Rhodoferax sp. PAMC 29310 TaxID=2822760 RepID=UPI001B32620B|nr:tRNA (adenosine(37)-N6)-threonylcarbamoyltransferase complex dimerization subunit type 1 TsaB [Rhodoferax sp. PAMC 29310]
MNLLAFDTSTDVMSIAAQRTVGGVAQVWQQTAVGGAQTSAHLIPVIQRLMAQADLRFDQLDAIVFGRGPGSFTGLRTACSVAQGLAFGAKVLVLPVDTLLAVAEDARCQCVDPARPRQVTAMLDARMDELYMACYSFESDVWSQTKDPGLIRPEDLDADDDVTLAGNVFTTYGDRLPVSAALRVAALPTAGALLRLAPALLAAGGALPADEALPLYIRDKVAKTTAERMAEKAAA